MRRTLSKPYTMGSGRSVCRQDLGLVNTISLDLDRLSLRLLQLAHCSICWISALQVFRLFAEIIRYVSSAYLTITLCDDTGYRSEAVTT